ncbi:NAD(P)-binding domain-containing protein [Pelagibacterium sp. HS1C4-1]|nr:NAD(P)-binding domain-containing protein [Pelagibacterium xiamenense]
MTTAIIGLGNMGKGLARRLAGTTDLVVAARSIETAAALARELPGVTAASVEDAIARADIIVLAMHYGDARDLASTEALDGKIVVDITNPITPDFSGLLFGYSTSASEEIQAAASGARVVKAFNTIFAQLFAAPAEATAGVPVYLAGDDESAVEAVADLVSKAGFAPENSGKLDTARLLEPLGMLNIRFAFTGRGTAIAPGWLNIAA